LLQYHQRAVILIKEREHEQRDKTEKEFREAVKNSGKTLVLFYSAWCPYCQAFLPVYEKQCKDDKGAACRVEVNDLEGLDEEYEVDVVPTVLCFENGKVAARLDGEPGRGLTEKQLLEFMKECTR